MLKKLLEELRVGTNLNTRQQNILARKLGLVSNPMRIIVNLILFFLGLVIIFVSFGYNPVIEGKNSYVFLVGVLIISFTIFQMTTKNNYKKILDYYDALNAYLEMAFIQYKTYEVQYVKCIPTLNNSLKSDKIFLLSDGYNFIIYDDFFKETSYVLPKAFWVNGPARLLEFNSNTIDEKPVVFTFDDIKSFRLVGNKHETLVYNSRKLLSKKINSRIEDNILALDQKPMENDYVIFTLNCGIVYKLSVEVYDWLVELLPLKELK